MRKTNSCQNEVAAPQSAVKPLQNASAAVIGYFYPQDLAAFRYRADEGGLSRIFGGIHFPSDESTGNAMGKQVAALAIRRDQLNGP